MKVLELFGGIGSPRKSLERLGISHEVVDYVEIDKYAVKSYNAIYFESYKPQDITKWDKDIEVDMIFHGSPCQDFSIAGKGKGGVEGTETRSSLMWHTVRIVEKLKPKYVIWENVKAVLNKNHKPTFDKYLEQMEALGYTNYYQVMNSKDYGIPQNRERVFTVSILDDQDFTFPPKQKLKLRLKDMLNLNDDRTTHSVMINYFKEHYYKKYQSKAGVIKVFDGERQGLFTSDFNTKRIYSYEGISPTLSTKGKFLIKELKGYNTAKESWILMGFSDLDFKMAELVSSNSQLYKQAGNSVVVNVLESLFKELLK